MTEGNPAATLPPDRFFTGGGEMGALMRAFDWARTPVGPIDGWPQSLRTALSILLDSRYPMYIAWGPGFVELYNDAFFAKLEAGQVEFTMGTVPINALLGDIEQLVAPQLAAKGLVYSYTEPATVLAVRTDEEKARQIILNLLTNAVKFTGANGQVSVKTRDDDGFVQIIVADTGRGIPQDKLDTIFEPFVQVDRHVTPSSHQGVGLGLAISRDLARAMGGDIAVESRVGSGSTFTLWLPRATA